MKIALLGFGVVGSGAYKIITEQPDCGLSVKRALVRTTRPGPVEGLLTTQINDIINDPEIELVAEAMGGVEPAYSYVMAAIAAGKHVVTANKQLICAHFRELAQAAQEKGVQLKYTASAGGGVPWLFNLLRAKRLDEIEAVTGSINGTCNFILGNMHKNKAQFADVLAEAQRMGYAEADPAADIDGLDQQRKCAISATLAFSSLVAEEKVDTAGIRHITAADIAWAEERGFVFKLMMHCRREKGGLTAYVEPSLLRGHLAEANMPIRSSIATLYGKYVGRLSFFGAGAGTLPTGMNMMQDAMDIYMGVGAVQNYAADAAVDNTLAVHPYYIRTAALLPNVREQGAGWALTEPMPVKAMHGLAKELAQKGEDVFFAGLVED